jgi:hypothetical protein
LFPHPGVVLLDQYSVILFFMHYYDWKWRTVGKYDSLYEYAVSKNGNEFTVLRDNSIWNLDLTQAGPYANIRTALATAPTHSLTIFCIDQFGSHVPHTSGQESIFQKNVRTLARRAGLQMGRLFVDGADVYADFAYGSGDRQNVDRNSSGPALTLAQPQETTVKTGFVVQPNGLSAMSLTGKNFEPGAIIFANGRRLETTFGNSGWMTALFPADLYATAGVVEVKVVNPDGKASNTINFLVRPK